MGRWRRRRRKRLREDMMPYYPSQDINDCELKYAINICKYTEERQEEE